eukprot:CAMPEP_0194498360 /NCGR_PEP_ID=MMETSP0253-20130528/15016_1 /TAXON_ID=2966 /ORGANISM="Noctiluca scintillans" /LENGTH=196 /DNA_ID=CAMNT_0039339993 /DNA_START=35 /DNA_END=625 /DNA_ORIENTATION=+
MASERSSSPRSSWDPDGLLSCLPSNFGSSCSPDEAEEDVVSLLSPTESYPLDDDGRGSHGDSPRHRFRVWKGKLTWKEENDRGLLDDMSGGVNVATLLSALALCTEDTEKVGGQSEELFGEVGLGIAKTSDVPWTPSAVAALLVGGALDGVMDVATEVENTVDGALTYAWFASETFRTCLETYPELLGKGNGTPGG